MGLYVKDDDVKIRLQGKVKFTEDECEENKMHVKLLRRLIEEAEGEVEFDLSPRFATPFVRYDDAKFDKLPARPTKEIIRTLCELKSVIRVLETDFGRGTAINGEAYAEKQRDRYKALLDKIMARKEEGSGTGWKYPPLLDLKLNYFNKEADDGFQGMVLTTEGNESGSYPSKTINDPASNWWNPGIEDFES